MNLELKLNDYPFKIILGSASPRRQELLKGLGFDFTVQPISAEEVWPDDLKGKDIALYLAKLKSDAFPRALEKDELLITADTIVWCEGRIFNKPADFEEGKRMLRALSGRMHEVFTGVCIRTKEETSVFCDASRVFFRELTDEEIVHYLTHFVPYDKAGGYGVQDWLGYIGIDKIEGSFYNVMGLPVRMVYDALVKLGGG